MNLISLPFFINKLNNMKQIFLYFGFLFSILITQSVYAQIFTNYTTSDGLLDDNVICLDIDTADNVWFGTQNGISKFDGTSWTSFTQNTYPGLIDNNINTILVASDDRVWVGTDFGISVFNGTSFTSFTSADGLGNNRVNHIAEDINGVIWFGEFSGVTKYDGTTFTAYSISDGLPFGGVKHIGFDSNNDAWFATALGGVVKYDGTTFTTISTPQGLLHNVANSLVIDNQNNKWVGTASGVSVINNAGQVFEHHTRMYIMPPPDTLNPVEDIDMDGQGRIWVGIYVDYLVTVGGVSMYDGTQWIDYDVSDGLVSPVIRQLDIDSQDNVWVVTSNGVSKISSLPNSLIDIQHNEVPFKIFPNPASDFLNVQFDNSATAAYRDVSIYSVSMQLISQLNVAGYEIEFRLPLNGLEPGFYFIRIDNEISSFIIH